MKTSRYHTTAAAMIVALGLAGALAPAVPALAQWGGPAAGARGGPEPNVDDPRNRLTVSIRTVPVGEFCVRAVEAVGYDPRLNQRLYRVGFDSGPMTSLGVTAYENAFSSARTQADAMRALAAARHDAEPYQRPPRAC